MVVYIYVCMTVKVTSRPVSQVTFSLSCRNGRDTTESSIKLLEFAAVNHLAYLKILKKFKKVCFMTDFTLGRASSAVLPHSIAVCVRTSESISCVAGAWLLPGE